MTLPEAELPPIDMGSSRSPSRTVTSSPAPGRPWQTRADKRSRESSGSPNGTNSKAARRESEVDESGDDEESSESRDWAKALKEANLVTDTALVSPVKDGAGLLKQPDLDMVLSISGTPGKSIPPSTSHVNSPVFTRHGKNSN